MGVNIESFETIFGIKNNIQALRNKVLELAIHGKLVEQNPTDAPASELLKRIQAEREELVKEGKIKKQKPLEPISEEEIPFVIPASWKWGRLGDIISITSGEGLTKINMAESGQYPVYGGNGVTGYHNYYNAEEETIVIGRVGFYCGSIHLTPVNSWITDNAFRTTYPKQSINRGWLIQTLKTMDLGRNDNATAQPVISQTKIYPLLIPIPPHKEQHRIFAKIESLMVQIDKLDESLRKKEYLMEQLPRAVVDVIGKCQKAEELKEQLQFMIENFESVFQTPESMQELRNVVLQLAIEGKLVPQDTTDEPASELIKRIEVEKNKLVKEGKIKKRHLLEPIGEGDIPFEIPVSWEWVRLGTITSYGDNITLSPEDISDEEWVLELEDIEKNSSKVLSVLYNKERQSKSNKNKFLKGDVLYGKLRPYLKKVIIAPNDGVCTTEIIAFRGYCDISAYYIVNYLKSQFVDKYVNSITHGMNMPRLGTDNAKALMVPLPPFAEQHRIVQKVESIMRLIDQMEVELKRKVDLVKKMASI